MQTFFKVTSIVLLKAISRNENRSKSISFQLRSLSKSCRQKLIKYF